MPSKPRSNESKLVSAANRGDFEKVFKYLHRKAVVNYRDPTKVNTFMTVIQPHSIILIYFHSIIVLHFM